MFRTIALSILLLLPAAAFAQSPVQALASCLADSTSGKDRKDLARWVFLAMASHPEISKYASREAALVGDESNQATAALFTRLLAVDCPTQSQAAVREGGGPALEGAFQTLGQLAMQELMSNAEVKGNMGAFEKYLDQAKLQSVLAPK